MDQTLTDKTRLAPPAAGDLLTLGFGTTVAMWTMGYAGWALSDIVPGWLTVALMTLCLLCGGWLTGRLTGRGWRGGLCVGLLVAVLNLLILGSLVEDRGEHAPPTALWLPGTILAMCLLATATAALGSRFATPSRLDPIDWTFRFTVTAIAATGLLLLAGGLVTGREAGLAVPDWPRSYGYNMFFYPLTKMKGNIYYEHAHRLLGSLVGLTTIALAAHLCMAERRRWLRWLAIAAVVAVIAQGVMGGYRVALADGSGAQVASPENETTASSVLRVAHGVSAQLFLALMAAIAAATSRTWRSAWGAAPGASRPLSIVLLALLLIQLLLGALLRHLNQALMLHVAFAAMVLLAALATGASLLTAQPRPAALRRLGIVLMAIVTVQVLLGITALIFRASSEGAPHPTTADVVSTTAHQLTGAALLAIATATALLVHRLSSGRAGQGDSHPREPYHGSTSLAQRDNRTKAENVA